MGKQEIAVLTRNKKPTAFIEKFFTDRKNYRPAYFNNPEMFLDHLRETHPAAIIVSGTHIKSVSEIINDFPSIALISGDINKNIKEAIRYRVKDYIYTPYLDIDLDHKIREAILEKALINKMECKKKELESIVDLIELISDTLDSKELLFRLVTKIAEIIPVTRCSIIKMDWRQKSAMVVASFEDPMFRGIKLNLKKYPEILEALASKKHVVIRDVLTDPLMEKVRDIISPLGIRSILVVPIFFQTRIIGTLFLRTSRARHTFTESEIGLLTSLAYTSANFLYNSFLYEQVEDEKSRLAKLSITDYLTGIYNIRYFYHRIVEEFSRAQRYASSLSCLMLDIDHFKKINDVYGHKAGDLVLKEFSGLLKRHSRKSDVLARYGGDEFILLLPETTPEGAEAEAKRIRKRIEHDMLKSLKSKKKITISVGIASYPHPKIKTHDDLISSADTALFNAKKTGRNKVTVYGT